MDGGRAGHCRLMPLCGKRPRGRDEQKREQQPDGSKQPVGCAVAIHDPVLSEFRRDQGRVLKTKKKSPPSRDLEGLAAVHGARENG
ncbi:hypothetical protein AKJ09_07659 [Labilithrix luteola]|uniref:Uncharacterized protein n=1 Tax=Labilithrix luteola TaxID=1391654 RepID=A0A0K1Q587_9BACT|nr:hypothetical protein AKJ09_07659 [Labilithrix luteola]